MVPASTPSRSPIGTAPPPGSETLDEGRWQFVVTDEHAVLPEGAPAGPGVLRLHLSRLGPFPRSLELYGR